MHRKKTCDVIQGCSGYKTIRWVFKESRGRMVRLQVGSRERTHRQERGGRGHRKTSGLLAEELGDREQKARSGASSQRYKMPASL